MRPVGVKRAGKMPAAGRPTQAGLTAWAGRSGEGVGSDSQIRNPAAPAMASPGSGVRVDPGKCGEDLLEPLQRADVAVARGRLRQTQHGGCIAVAQLLEVAQGEHLAVERVHPVERLLEAQLSLGADGGLRGTGEPAEE